MLAKVEARNIQGDLLSLLLDDVSDGIVLADVEGLDPVKATIVSSSFAQQDGVQFHKAIRAERNIVLKLDLEPDYISTQVSDVRSRLYDFFMTKSEVKLRFYMTNDLEVDITGRVEDCPTPMFTQKPKMNVSIICFDPDFVDITPVELEGETVDDTTDTTVDYVGSSETGFVLELLVDRTLTEFSIYVTPPDGILRQMDIAVAMVSGDVLTISTVPGDKYANLLHSGTLSSVVYGVPVQSAWPLFSKGENKLRVYVEGAEIPYTVTYYNRYGAL